MPDPTTLWFVLWTWMAVPWNFGTAPMTPGWWASLSFPPPYAEAECRHASKYGAPMGIKVQCLPAGTEPSPIVKRAPAS